MTYDQLVTLEAIVTQGSFKAASEFLHKSQPSLSVAIKKLEEQFQMKIFDRSEYRPKLTSEGLVFYDKAKVALMHMKSLHLFGEELGMGIESEIKVGIESLSPLHIILCSLKTFFNDFSATNLTLEMDSISGTITKLLAGELNFGFTPMHDEHEEIESIEFYTTTMTSVCTPEFFKKYNDIDENLKRLPQVILTDSIPNSNKSFGIVSGARKWVVSDMLSKKAIIAEGLGWGRLPHFLIEDELKSGKLVTMKVSGVTSKEVKVFIARNKSIPMGPVSKKLWKKLSTEGIGHCN